MAEVPHFLQDCPVKATTQVGDGTGLQLERVLDLAELVGGLVRGHNSDTDPSSTQGANEDHSAYVRCKHIKGRILLESADRGLIKVNDFLVFPVFGTVAGYIERRRASGMLGKLVRPEIAIWGTLVNPVFVH